MSSPKDITGSLTRWRGAARPESPAVPEAPRAATPPHPPLRRLRADIPGGLIYVLLAGCLFSQWVFLGAFDLF